MVAYTTVLKTRQDQQTHAEKDRAISASRDLAVHLVSLYDEMKALELRQTEPTDDDLGPLTQLADTFRASVVVDGPFLPESVLTPMKGARRKIAAFLTTRDGQITRVEIKKIRPVVWEAGERLREFKSPTKFGHHPRRTTGTL